MKLHATTAAALSLALPLTAAAQVAFTDPANLRGERPNPRTGRELPIDGGLAANGQPDAALGLQQLLRKLNTRASLMLIVAHPDDEDGGMLTLVSRGLGARVADLSLTRGEGGQNAMTGDFEDALGLIRTQELLSSDRYTGVNQFFGTEVDFGFSKTKEEAFRKWTHQRVLYDAVRAVRLYRPLVIAAVFLGGVTDGHGQHQVSGEIAQEVFNAAADPTVFPELTREGILPWAPLKVYARVPSFAITAKGLFDYATDQYVPPSFTNYVTGVTTTTPPTADVILHEGQTDPLLTNAAANPEDLRQKTASPNTPLSYVQFARIGLGLQRTQIGPNVRLAAPGAFDVSYHRYGSRLPNQPEHETSFFDGIDTSLLGIATLAPSAKGSLKTSLAAIQQSIQQAQQAFNPSHPEAVADPLSHALQQTDAAIRSIAAIQPNQLTHIEQQNLLHELRIKRVQLNDALTLALGLQLQADPKASTPNVLRDTRVPVSLTLTATTPTQLLATTLDTAAIDQIAQIAQTEPPPPTETLTPAHPLTQSLTAAPALTSITTQPYFFRTDIEQAVYTLRDPNLRNAPATPPALVAWARLSFNGATLRLGQVVNAGAQPLSVVPPASLALATHAQVIPNTAASTPVTTLLIPASDVTPTLRVPPGWTATPASNAKPGGQVWQILAPAAPLRSTFTLAASAALPDSQLITQGFRSVGYPGLVLTNFYTPATDRIVPVDLNLPTRRRIGYLPGTGDSVAEDLRSIGFEVTNLTVPDLTPARLASFDTVVLGVRTYNAHPDLHGAPTQALFDFARAGGNVLVQYQTPEFTAADAPYPLSLGANEKVVDENAPVQLLDPANPALTTPNRITSADFNGWIEERGHGFLATWDPHYTALTETHDPGAPAEHIASQLPQRGGLITTPLGRGHWTYVAFALYRQLPQAVPGAFRLITDLVAQ